MARDKTIVKKSLVYLLSNILVSLIPLLFLPILTRFLAPEEYNIVAMFQSVMLVTGAVLGFSINGYCNIKYFEIKENLEKFKYYITNGIALLLLMTIFLLFLSFIFSFTEYDFYGLQGSEFILITVAFFSQYVIYLRLGLYQVRGLSVKYGLLTFFHVSLNMAITLLLVTVFHLGYFGRLLGIVMAMFIVALLCLFTFYRERMLVYSFRHSIITDMIKYGISYCPIILLATAVPLLERIVVTEQLGASDSGIFVVSTQISNGVLLIFSSIATAYTPIVYKRLADDYSTSIYKKNILREAIAVVFVMLLAIVVVKSGFPAYILNLILPESYHSAIELSLLLALAVTLKLGFIIWSIYLTYYKLNSRLSIFNFIFAFVYVTGLCYFVEDYGLNFIGYYSASMKLLSSIVLGLIVWIMFDKIATVSKVN